MRGLLKIYVNLMKIKLGIYLCFQCVIHYGELVLWVISQGVEWFWVVVWREFYASAKYFMVTNKKPESEVSGRGVDRVTN
ncbi:hypothetical protein VB10N_32850 [Vibrio sp. 10N]|nr:hypothetical protein VB10N_32850 [Vibrio sp. 10N]